MQLPDIPDVASWKSFVRSEARREDGPFARVIDAVWEAEGLGRATPVRAERGSTPVFFVGDLVVKFVPPPYLDEAVREVGALRELEGKLPVATPEVVATGLVSGWRWLVTTRLAGSSLRDDSAISEADRCSVAEQVGDALRALHALAPDGFHEGSCDWSAFMRERVSKAPNFQLEHGLHPDAVGSLDAWFDGSLIPDDRRSLLHGDLHHEHVLLERVGASVRVVGLIDFGDAIVGHREYELVTPMFFVASTSRDAQRALLSGYGYALDDVSARRLTALSAAHQFNALARFLPKDHGANALDVVRDLYWSTASAQGAAAPAG